MSEVPPCITLTDNGSFRPDATLSLRALTAALGKAAGRPVHPVSLLHSQKIAPADVGGRPADTIEPFFLSKREEGVHSFLVVPLFFGPSAAIAEYLPQRVEALRQEQSWPELEVRIAPCLVDHQAPHDDGMAKILLDLIDAKAREHALTKSSIALVDHGSPRIEVTKVRNFLAGQLVDLAGARFDSIAPCSMERRSGSAYDFNEPLMENLLGRQGFRGNVIVSMLFLQPGRHAGSGGDVAEICADAEDRHRGLKTYMTGLVGEHPDLLSILHRRLDQGLKRRVLYGGTVKGAGK